MKGDGWASVIPPNCFALLIADVSIARYSPRGKRPTFLAGLENWKCSAGGGGAQTPLKRHRQTNGVYGGKNRGRTKTSCLLHVKIRRLTTRRDLLNWSSIRDPTAFIFSISSFLKALLSSPYCRVSRSRFSEKFEGGQSLSRDFAELHPAREIYGKRKIEKHFRPRSSNRIGHDASR